MNPDQKFPRQAPPTGAPSPATPAGEATTLAAALRNAAGDLQQQPMPAELQARVLAAAQAAGAARADRSVAPRVPVPSSPSAAPLVCGSEPRRPASRPPSLLSTPATRGSWGWSGAAACAVVLLGSALLMLRTPAPDGADDTVRLGAVEGRFLPLVPAESWPAEAAPAWLVSTELTGERLAALGLPYDPAHAGDSVRAELLLHPSGEVLAVRFLH